MDKVINSHLLYRLSYWGMWRKAEDNYHRANFAVNNKRINPPTFIEEITFSRLWDLTTAFMAC